MAADKDKAFKFRFRHLEGDLGPFPFQENTSVLAMKGQIWEEWPNEGNLADKVCSCQVETVTSVGSWWYLRGSV